MLAIIGVVLQLVLIWEVVFGGVIEPITNYTQIPDSGDQYPTELPLKTQDAPFAGKRVLFAVGHGAEDHEIYYVHQYFLSRGATVLFGCANDDTLGVVVIHDFIKPTYKLMCTPLSLLIDLSEFDVVYVAGGVPSSSAVRTNLVFIKAMRNFWLSAGEKKILAVICSGVESLIDTEILQELPVIVGSPASFQPLERAFQANFLPASNYRGMDDNYHAISYPSSFWKTRDPLSTRTNLVVGKNPDNSREFVVEIGNTWMNLGERVPLRGEGVPLSWKNGRYYDPQFIPIYNMGDIPKVNTLQNCTPPSISEPSAKVSYTNIQLPNKHMLFPFGSMARVGIVISLGASANEVNYLNNFYINSGNNVTFICPQWIIQYKGGKVVLHSEPPILPLAIAYCHSSTSDALTGEFDVVVVPGGLFSTGGVLRNDHDTSLLLHSYYQPQGNSKDNTWTTKATLQQFTKYLLFTGSGLQTMISARIGYGALVASISYCSRDLLDAGYKPDLQQNQLAFDNVLTVATLCS